MTDAHRGTAGVDSSPAGAALTVRLPGSWTSPGSGVASGWLDAGVIAGHPMGYQDMAPLPVLITEAGGRVSDLAGGDLLAGAGDVLTSNGHLHDQLVELVAGLPTGPRPHP